MLKLKYIWIIPAFLAPLVATKSNAQLDLFSPVEVMREQHCLDHPELINEPSCKKYYRQNPRRVNRPNSANNSCRRVITRLEELHRQGVTQATVQLPGAGTITDSPDDLIDDVQAMCDRNSNAIAPTLTVAPQTPSNPSSSSDNLYEQGNRLFEQGNYQGALVAFNQVIAINPENAEAYVSRSYARYVLRDYREALEDANRAISLNSSLVNAYAVRGIVHHALRNYQGELADANLIIRLDRSSTLGYMNRSGARYALGNYRGALADASQAVRLDPKLPEAYIFRSIARLGLGDRQKALKDVNQAVTLGQSGIANKRLAGAYSVRSIVQYELGNVDRVINDSQKAIALDEESVGSMLILAVALHTKGDRQESLRLATKAIHLDSNRSSLQYLKERGWGNRLLADTKTFFQSPQIKGLLTRVR